MESDFHLGENQFMKKTVYENLEWEITNNMFNTHIIAIAPYGGPIAVTKDTSQISSFAGTSTLDIYSPSGKKIGSGNIPEHVTLVPEGMFWTSAEEIVLLSKQGAILIYNMQGAGPSVFEILSISSDDRVLNFCPFHRTCVDNNSDNFSGNVNNNFDNNDALQVGDSFITGLVVLCESGRVLMIEDVATATMDDVCMLGRHSLFIDQRGMSKRSITCMTVLNTNEEEDPVRVLFGTSDMSILLVNDVDITDLNLQSLLPGAVMKMAVIPNGGLVACWCSDGSLIVLKENLKERLAMQMDTKSINVPRQMAWVGPDAVMLYWRKFGLLMVGPTEEWVQDEETSEPFHIVQEIDCCRVLTASRYEVIMKCSDKLTKTFEAGSTDPPAILFEAWQADENNESRVDDSIRALEEDGKLQEAVSDLLIVARSDFPEDSTFTAADVLKAASYGYGFCLGSGYHFYDTIPTVARRLRLLHSLREVDIAIPMTDTQLRHCGYGHTVKRLTRRHLHRLAVQICRDKGIDISPVLIHWACVKIQLAPKYMNDTELCNNLQNQLKKGKFINYGKIARQAAHANRPLLAAQLLEHEPKASNRTSMFFELQQYEKALVSAIESNDANIVFKTLFAIKGTMLPRDKSEQAKRDSEEEFLNLIVRVPNACTLLESYLNRTQWRKRRAQKVMGNDTMSPEYNNNNNVAVGESGIFDGFLAKLYDYTEQRTKAANLMAKLSYSREPISRRLDGMNVCTEMYAVAAKQSSYNSGPASILGGIGNSNNSSNSNNINGNADKSAYFFASTSAEHRNLLALQADLEKTFGRGTFINISLTETMKKILKLGTPEFTKMAIKMKNDFKVSDRRFWYIKLQALSERGEWVELRRFAAERRSPIGYVPFANVCIAKNEEGEALHYIQMVKKDGERLDLYEKIGKWEMAMQLAYKLGDGNRLRQIYQECGSLQLQSECEELARKMGFRF